MNTDDSARLSEAADYLDHLHEGSRHIPTDLRHSERIRGRVEDTDENTVGLFFYGGAPEVFLALGPASLPLLSHLLRQESMEKHGHIGHASENGSHCCPTSAALALADHVLKAKGSSV